MIEDTIVKVNTYKSLSRTKKKSLFRAFTPYLYLMPAVILVAILFICSAIYTLFISFTTWNGIDAMKFVGINNYIQIFTDPIFLKSFLNTVIWIISTLIFPVGLGLALAVILQQLKFSGLFQNILYLPNVLAATTAGVMWHFLLSNNGISSLFDAIGLHNWAIDWLNTPPYNTYAMIVAYTWQATGTNLVLFLVGLQTIPKDSMEAALLDGATGWKMFQYITFPLLKPITSVVVLMALVNSFKVFDQIWVMTEGGPYRSSETLAVTMYRESFVLSHYGTGSAIAIILSIFVLALSWGYLRNSFKREGL